MSVLAARGRPARRRARDPHSVRVPGPVQVEPRLGPARREGARARRPAAVPAAREDGRRLRVDQRDDLPPRPPRSTSTAGRRTAPTGWSYDEVLPYFKRSEDNERGEDEFHGVGGPLSVSESRSMQPLVDAMLDAAVAGGLRADPGPERRPPGGRRALPAHAAERQALLRPPTRSSIRPPDGRTSRCARACSRSGSSSTATVPSASRSSRTARPRRSAPSAR